MSATLPETTYPLDHKQMQADLQRRGHEAAQPGSSSTGILVAAGAAVLGFGASLVLLLREGAPAGETSIKRQML